MKSIKTQYIDLMEGRMSQYNFMRSLRMSLPQYITNVTSFKDSVKILKNKGILSENMDVKDEDEEFIDMIAKTEEEEAGKYTKFDDFEGGLSEKAFDGLKIEWDWDNADVDYDTDEEGNEGAFGTVFGRDEKGNAYSARFDTPVTGGDADFDSADISDIEKTEDASELYEGKKKREPKKELHPNQINPQELRMGIKVELEHTDDIDKAKKIALDHLAENPFYYTALKLSGIESPSAPKAKPPVAFKKEVAAETELVDKVNAMKPVKGFEKAKASSNKAKKETNNGVKGVSELTHNAKSVRGLQKFAATGGKMKTVKEGQLNEAGGEYTFNGTLTKDEQIKLKDMIGNYELDVQATDDTYETTISHPTYNDKSLEHALKQVREMLPQKKQFGYTAGFGNVLQSKLEALVREVMNEIADGGDDMNPQYAQDEINENEKLTPQEKKIADDILNSLNEGFDSLLDKIKSYSKKGLMTAAILGSLLSSSQFSQAQQNQIKQISGIEATMQKGGGIEKMNNQDAYNHVYNMIKKNADGVIKQLQNYKASSQEDKNDVNMILTFANSVKKGSPIKDVDYMGKRFKMASNVINKLNTNSTAKFTEFY